MAKAKAETQKFMGRNKLVDRLSAQVGSTQFAKNILKSRGDLKADGETLTANGAARNKMTAKERAVDRESKYSGKPKADFKYTAKTNSATLKKRSTSERSERK